MDQLQNYIEWYRSRRKAGLHVRKVALVAMLDVITGIDDDALDKHGQNLLAAVIEKLTRQNEAKKQCAGATRL